MTFFIYYVAALTVALGIAGFIGGFIGMFTKQKLKTVPIKTREYVKPLHREWWED